VTWLKRQRRLPQLEQLERRELLTVTIDNMHLVSDTGYSSTDRVTSNPSVAATINGMFSGSYMNLQFDHRADGSIQGTAYANMPGQQITYDPRVYESSLSTYTGPFTLRYRSIEYNSQGAVVATGAWVDYTMTLEQSSSPEIEGSVYGMRLPNAPRWRTMIDPPTNDPGTIIFKGNAAELFTPHEVWGPFSGLKRFLGQRKAGFGDIVFDDAYKVGDRIFVYETHLGSHAGQLSSEAAKRLWQRRAFDLTTDGIIIVGAGYYFWNKE
jgi:hypothetical protein